MLVKEKTSSVAFVATSHCLGDMSISLFALSAQLQSQIVRRGEGTSMLQMVFRRQLRSRLREELIDFGVVDLERVGHDQEVAAPASARKKQTYLTGASPACSYVLGLTRTQACNSKSDFASYRKRRLTTEI